MDCLFCKIVKGEIPCAKIYEDDLALAFLDIKPINPGHILLIPKEHTANLNTASEEILKHLIALVPRLAEVVKSALGYPAYNLGVNVGAEAGQLIEHLHFHLMPRRVGDGHELFQGKAYEAGEMERVQKVIIDKLG